MARIRTHNRRAARKRLSWRQIEQREARRIVRAYRKGYPHIKRFVEKFFREEGSIYGTVSGRMVPRGPEPQYQLPKLRPAPVRPDDMMTPDYTALEHRIFDTLSRKADIHAKIINYGKLYGITGPNLFKVLTKRGRK